MSEPTTHRSSTGVRSIRRKQTLVIMLTSCVSLLLACGGFVIYEVVSFKRAILGNLTTLADVVAANSTTALQFRVPATARENLTMLRADPNIEGAWVVGGDGRVFAQYHARPGAPQACPVLPVGQHRFTADTLELSRAVWLDEEVI